MPQVPRTRQTARRLAFRSSGPGIQSGRLRRNGHHARQVRRERVDPPHRVGRRRRADAAEARRSAATRSRRCGPGSSRARTGRKPPTAQNRTTRNGRHRRGPSALVVSAAELGRAADGQGRLWSRTPIDRFIVAALESKGIRANPPADRRTLIRRVYFDLIGLPPSPERLRRSSPTPRPRRTRSWSIGCSPARTTASAGAGTGSTWPATPTATARRATPTGRTPITTATSSSARSTTTCPFRDVRPLATGRRRISSRRPAAVAATGFLTRGAATRCWPTTHLEEERLRLRLQRAGRHGGDDGAAFLGLTLGCARCHDHKYDAIPTRDYYRLLCAFHDDGGERKCRCKDDRAEKAATMLAITDTKPEPEPTWLFERGDFYAKKEPRAARLSARC